MGKEGVSLKSAMSASEKLIRDYNEADNDSQGITILKNKKTFSDYYIKRPLENLKEIYKNFKNKF